MAVGGDWLLPRREDGGPRFEKQIFPYWLTAAPFLLTAESLLTARLWTYISQLLRLWVVYTLGKLLHGERLAAAYGARALATMRFS